MKKCKENYIKILAAMRDNSYDVARLFEKDNNTKRAEMLRSEAMAYQVAIWILSDYNNSFEAYGKNYLPEEFEK